MTVGSDSATPGKAYRAAPVGCKVTPCRLSSLLNSNDFIRLIFGSTQ